MATSDLNMLIEMGFDKERAELAVKKTGNLQGAIDWLEKHQEKSLEDIKAEITEQTAGAATITPSDTDEQAQSLVCNVCGKKFRGAVEAEYHATKTEHTDFSESTDEIKPLTAEEKEAKLEELRQRMAAKRADVSDQDKLEKKQNEEIRRKATKESQDIREELAKQEQIKEAAKKRREKLQEVEARKRALARIETDKAERRLKAEREKAARAGQAPPPAPEAAAPAPLPGVVTSKPASAYTETRLRLQTAEGTVQKTFAAETTLFEVAHAVAQEKGVEVQSFTQNYPKKVWDSSDFGQTLREAGMVPSAALIVK